MRALLILAAAAACAAQDALERQRKACDQIYLSEPETFSHEPNTSAMGQARNEQVITGYGQFDWGREKWDLIVCSYFLPQSARPKIWESLKPSGLIVVEGFHADTARIRPIGGGYTDKSLLEALQRFRFLAYEDVEDKQEWGRRYGAINRLVRVLAQKPVWQAKPYRDGETMCFGGMSEWKCGAGGWEYSGKCQASR